MEELLIPQRVVDISEPILAEDSTLTSQALSLRAVREQLGENATHHDYLVALMLVLLAESGFRVLSSSAIEDSQNERTNKFFSKFLGQKSTSDSSKSSSVTLDNLGYNQNTRLVYIPADWKSPTGSYEMYFVLHKSRNILSKLIATPYGDRLIINMFPYPKGKFKTYGKTLQSLRYMLPGPNNPCSQYINLKSISHGFKDTLATPLRTDILNTLKLTNPSLEGLPLELQLKIIGMLDIPSLENLARCTLRFSELCSETLFRRGCYVISSSQITDHLETYIVQWHPQIRIPRNYFKTRGVPSSHIGSILKKIKTWNPFREKEKLPELEWPIIYDDMGKFRRIDYNKVKYARGQRSVIGEHKIKTGISVTYTLP